MASQEVIREREILMECQWLGALELPRNLRKRRSLRPPDHVRRHAIFFSSPDSQDSSATEEVVVSIPE